MVAVTSKKLDATRQRGAAALLPQDGSFFPDEKLKFSFHQSRVPAAAETGNWTRSATSYRDRNKGDSGGGGRIMDGRAVQLPEWYNNFDENFTNTPPAIVKQIVLKFQSDLRAVLGAVMS
uniref:Uncharacterized protein n=1 Tax=Romanomermis culicivorax TaxID=13658 RepID=A0A915HQM7_ROMCU